MMGTLIIKYANKMMVFMLVILFMLISIHLIYAQESNYQDPERITITIHNSTIKDIINKISKKTSYTIKISEELSSHVVSGKFNNEPIESFFRRIFKGYNLALTVDSRQRILTVKTFGERDAHYIIATASNNRKINDLPLESDEKSSYRKRIEREQLKSLSLFLNNDNSIDPSSGKTLGERREIERLQLAKLEKYRNDPNSIDPASGKTIYELKNIEKKQLAYLQSERNSQHSIDPSSNMSLTERKKIEQKQLQILNEYLNNPGSIDPLSGKTLQELREIEKQQKKLLAR